MLGKASLFVLYLSATREFKVLCTKHQNKMTEEQNTTFNKRGSKTIEESYSAVLQL